MKRRPLRRQPPSTAGAPPREWPWGLAATALALLVYLPALRHGFIWDDPLVLEQLRAIHGLRELLLPPEIVPKYYYRPLIFLSFLLDRSLGGETPFWFHFSVVLAHGANTALLWWLGVRLLGSASASALAAALFAVHPIHVESVAWIAGRSDVLAATLLLLSAAWLTHEQPRWTRSAAVAAYGLALFAKEAALGALLILPLLALATGRRPSRQVLAALLAVTVSYLMLRRLALGAAVTGFASSATPAAALRDLLAALGFYTSKLLLPVNLSAYVPEVPAGWLSPALGLVTALATAAAAGAAWRQDERVTACLLAWFLVTLAPALAVIVRISAQAPVAERYLYIPSIAACLLCGRLLVWLAARRPSWLLPARVAVLGLSAVFAVLCLARNRVWADDVLFWQDVAAKAPDYALGHRELAMIYMNRNQLEAADMALQRALAGKSDRDARVMTLNNAGNLYLRQQRLDEAERMFNEGLKLHSHPYLHYGLGRLAMTRAEQAQARNDAQEVNRQVAEARAQLQRSLALDPRSAKSQVLLGQVLYSLGDRTGAREHLEQALRLDASAGVAGVARRYLQMLGAQ
ncbi:MAG: tetratricopeptide repeat protein [Deltaproteobacteria bacterium]|nr:tetratricopeptide repeat protein [Deltaproteobacteria bacterium]